MLTRLQTWLHRLRRALDPSQWFVAVLGLPRLPGVEGESGLVMIQIDGLGRAHLERALDEGRMPFVSSLLAKDGYQLRTVYSGCPASTPAFQAELFYGRRGTVPAFGFKRRGGRDVVRMYQPAAAQRVEAELDATTTGLLAGGSAYADIFTGGAAESHLCAASFGLSNPLRSISLRRLVPVLLLHGLVLVKTLCLALLELFLGLGDALHGMSSGHGVLAELRFILARAFLCVTAREFSVRSASMDVARGLPVVHVNLLGFDEQAHRRGPSSSFARWSLGGVDHAIARLTRAAWRSGARDYEVWIHSDHGQDDAIPYLSPQGHSLVETLEATLGGVPAATSASPHAGSETKRALWSGFRLAARLLGQESDSESGGAGFVVAALGPLGHVYPDPPLEAEDRARIARSLVDTAGVPQVSFLDAQDRVMVSTPRGPFSLQDEPELVLGEDHPYLEFLPQDMEGMVRHADAGQLVLSGWDPSLPPVTFADEHGSHGGYSPGETRAFALLPPGCLLEPSGGQVLRANDLREEALAHLGRLSRPRPSAPRSRPRPDGSLRVVTYNAHACIGGDGRISASRVARTLATLDPDVIALQELDVGRQRTHFVDQAGEIAERLEMFHHFHAVFQLEAELYGNAILSRLPMRLVRAGPLPGLPGRHLSEPRGVQWVEIDLGDKRLQLFNTHLSFLPFEGRHQQEALMGLDWLGHPECQGPVVVCGDLNTSRLERLCGGLPHQLRDSQGGLGSRPPRPTWSTLLPLRRLDHVLVSTDIEVLNIEVPRNRLTRRASDHLPLVVELSLR